MDSNFLAVAGLIFVALVFGELASLDHS